MRSFLPTEMLAPLVLVALLLAVSPSAAAAPAPAADVVFTRHLGGTGVADLYAVRTDGTSLRRLTTTRNNFDPAYSPDGRRIAFASDRVRSGAPELYVMDADGRNVRRLTWSANDRKQFFINAQPAWSRDGRTIVFVRTRVRIAASKETTDVWSVPAAGGAPRRVTSHAGREASPAMTPTGAIAFERGGRIYRLDGATPSFVTAGTDPAWSRSGRLAFVRDGSVHVVAGRRAYRLVRGTSPTWTPDGRRIVYAGRDGLSSIAASGGEARRVTVPRSSHGDVAPSIRG